MTALQAPQDQGDLIVSQANAMGLGFDEPGCTAEAGAAYWPIPEHRQGASAPVLLTCDDQVQMNEGMVHKKRCIVPGRIQASLSQPRQNILASQQYYCIDIQIWNRGGS